ncbi:MAG: hypothetical protein Q4D60_10410 [Eubacteriales bacterium]|nr:hypothetical protein [Eubacteriales bacterium]
MFRRKKQEISQKIFPLEEMVSELLKLGEQQWGSYAFYHEPLERKFTEEQKKEYTARACACGREEARKLMTQFPGRKVRDIIKDMGLKGEMPDLPTGGGHVIFAQYTEPDQILVFGDCVKKAEKMIEEANLWNCLGKVNIEEILFAHELFHAVEFQKKREIYTQTEKIELWRKPFSNKSKILCLSEMAAMEFAKELTGISFSPYVLDVLLMYGYEKEAASALYEEILEAAGIREREE